MTRTGGDKALMEDYPGHLLNCEPAPRYEGEGPHALWHFSDNPSLGRFEPRVSTKPSAPRLVWAVDSRHAPMFWFPRDCPRGCFWPVSTTTQEDRERFFGQSAAGRIHIMESDWLRRMRDGRVYAYRLPAESFRPDDVVGGFWVSDWQVEAIEQVVLDDLLGAHAAADIELRITPRIGPLWERVVESTVEFVGSKGLLSRAKEPGASGA
ncbi:MAG TPA: hypothetical protein VGX23_27860 [Actinocrinis sp.]|nr:hypothetical protein [Actinocrinis sp.]